MAMAVATSRAVLGTNTPSRHDLVDRGIGGVAAARIRVEQHLAFGFAAKPRGQGGVNVPGNCKMPGMAPAWSACGCFWQAPPISHIGMAAVLVFIAGTLPIYSSDSKAGVPHADARLSSRRAALPADSRAQPGAGPHPAGHQPSHHRSSRPGIRRAGAEMPHRHPRDFQDPPSGGDLSRLRHRRLGSGAGQHHEPRRPCTDVRDRPVRRAVGKAGAAAGTGAGNRGMARAATAICPMRRAGVMACRRD